jgi:hypothetical protein
MALVQAAVHDAVQAIQWRFEPYAADLKGSGSPAAAAAAAAYGVLGGIYPKQQNVFERSTRSFSRATGLPAILVCRSGNRPRRRCSSTTVRPRRWPITRGSAPGSWRPTPSSIGNPPLPAPLSPMAALYLIETKPYTLERSTQFRPEAPPALTSAAYLRDYNEVRAKAPGAAVNSTRMPAQTDLAHFWFENYVAQWNRALKAIVEAKAMEIGDRARLFALADLAAADAVIACWDAKRHFSFWRPVTAVREGENDGNPQTAGDPSWEPLVSTPNYPDYTSGANVVTAATLTIL